MTEQLTHWKKTKNPNYLGSWVLQPNEELILTIKSGGMEEITNADGKKETELVIHFSEDYKPMIVNSTNAKTISKVLKTPYVEQWVGHKVQIYARRIRAFGEEVDALRIRDFLPKVEQIDPTKAIESIKACKTLDELKVLYTSLSKDEQGHPDIVKAKDKMKSSLK